VSTLRPYSVRHAPRSPWVVVGLLFVVALVNYFDRQSLSVVAPRFQAELHLSDEGYGHVVSLFLLASAFAYALSGFVSDALGTRRSMALFVGWWSLAEAATAWARTIFGLGAARFLLGLGEPGLWVAAPKAVGEIFEKRRRGLAIGIYTLGATVGAVVAIPAIAFFTSRLPWRSIFLIDGAAGLLWLPLWLYFYRNPSVLAPVAARSAVRLSEVFSRGKLWQLMLARGLTDPVWYFFLFWFPKYLQTARGMTLAQMAHVGWTVYLAAGLGTLLGGLGSGVLIRRGVEPALAYRRVMLICACLLPVAPLINFVGGPLPAVAIASVVAMAHMAWLVSLTSTIVELFPAGQVGKAAGLVAAGSGLGGMLSSEAIAWFVSHGGYAPVFWAMAILHPIAIALLWTAFKDRTGVEASTPSILA
jgi:ACS family hexuronate transporter-like MFS transporter